ncbi:MAG: alpha/beta fold hydrolase [Cyanophyceae cyanobacterium]
MAHPTKNWQGRTMTNNLDLLSGTLGAAPAQPIAPKFPACPYQWQWRGFRICYQQVGNSGPAVLLVHGFGASWRHWRKNVPLLAESCRVFAIDLLGFGGSDKPDPADPGYTFETWSQQLQAFTQEVIGEPTFLVGNSIGCVVALQLAVDAPEWVRGMWLLNCSLRLLHDRRLANQPWFKRIGAPILQEVLKRKAIGHWFFRQLARPKTVKNILTQAYYKPEAVTNELVDILMEPAGDPGAADVFLAFTGYSQGPLPEDLLQTLSDSPDPCPVAILWGTEDPWEPVDMGRQFEQYACVEKFVALEEAGHCPQDETPELVNYWVRDWILWKADMLPRVPEVTEGERVIIETKRPDGDPRWNGRRGTVAHVGRRAITIILDNLEYDDSLGDGTRQHFYREDIRVLETQDGP